MASRFGRRVFGLLIAVVIVPAAIAAFVAVVNLEHELRQQADRRLHRSAKEYGLSLYQRLSAVKREASAIRHAPGTGIQTLPFRAVDIDVDQLRAGALTRTRRDGNPEPNGPLLFFTEVNGSDGLYMVFRDQLPYMTVEIDRDYVWGPQDHLPLSDMCVTSQTGSVLHCSTPAAAALLEVAPGQLGEAFDVEFDGKAYLGYARELFLPSEFDAGEWTIHAYQPEQEAMSAARSFQYLFTPAIVAVVASTLLLGVGQIRRRLRPLDRLIEGTRRVADRDFSTRIEVGSGDEFEDLAEAFNGMTHSLEQQVGTLEALSSIDRTILATSGFEAVFNQVLRSLRDLTPMVFGAIAVPDQDSDGRGRVYLLPAGSGVIEQFRCSMSLENHEWQGYEDGVDVLASDLPFTLPHPLRGRKEDAVFVVPFSSDDQLDGLLCLGLEGSRTNDYSRQAAADFSERLAVAAASIKKEQRLQKQANFDHLTGLPNRLLLRDRLDRSLILARRSSGQVAVLFLDLDRFKTVNDTLGHTRGDELLVEATERLVACIKESDTVARLGGDEFVVLLTGFDAAEQVVAVANRILERLAVPFTAGKRAMLLGASVGIALYPRDGDNTEELLRKADTAMYEAKGEGRGRYRFFDDEMNLRLENRARMESDLWRAVQNDELELWYQPQMDPSGRRVLGAEALIRWRHPEHGIVLPGDFVPLAEQTGLIESIGAQALTLACEDFMRWRGEGFDLERVAVNVSPREFMQKSFVSRVADTLHRFAVPPLRLVLEITENLLIQDTTIIRKQLSELHELGVSFSIDDFGTGYSSLSYLQKLPVDTLKIDTSFIRDVTTNMESQAIVAAVLDMARRLDLKVVAEGVETAEQLDYLRRSGCENIQGFFYSKPLPSSEFLKFVRDHSL